MVYISFYEKDCIKIQHAVRKSVLLAQDVQTAHRRARSYHFRKRSSHACNARRLLDMEHASSLHKSFCSTITRPCMPQEEI